jgi:dTDP-4-amino-4,6-dideoxygalactose transaminase
MAALLCDLAPGDEVIMPSFTFVSTANAFALRGAVPVFVDIRPDTLNLDEKLIERAITDKTRAIVPVHYAGVGCEMNALRQIAKHRGLAIIEDAAQAMLSTYDGQSLGTFGEFATFSFHETKNVTCGEGGALIVNDLEYAGRAEIIREKGTNRSRYFRGQVDKYTWVDCGSSFLPGELVAAFLLAQLNEATQITERRLAIWQRYHDAFESLERRGVVSRPQVPAHCKHNAHMYYLLLEDQQTRADLITYMRGCDISAVFHYVPLHSSPFGMQVGRATGDMRITTGISDRLLRLPLWVDLGDKQDCVIEAVCKFLQGRTVKRRANEVSADAI